MSKLERTLRLPRLLREASGVFLIRGAPKWFLMSLVVLTFVQRLAVSAVAGFFLVLLWEMLVLKNWYEKELLPKHFADLSSIQKSFEGIEALSKVDMVKLIESTVRKSAWGIIRMGYVGLAAWGWEIIFRTLYPFLVSSRRQPYYHLLIGFPNKSTEADEALWQVAQEKDESKKEKRLRDYLGSYGSRVEDLDLSYPTLRERDEAVRSMMTLYGKLPSPRSVLERSVQKREESLKEVLNHLRVPRRAFLGFLHFVQGNVRLREDRRFYYFQADYYLRQMLFRLAMFSGVPQGELFNRSWNRLKNYAA